VLPSDPRITLTASTLAVTLTAGVIDLTGTSMSAVAYTRGPDSGPSDPLLILPGFHLPMVRLTFNITVKLPGGRNPLFHHAFPILTAPAGLGVVQEPVDVFAMMVSEGYALGIDIKVDSDKSPMGRNGGLLGIHSSSDSVSVQLADVVVRCAYDALLSMDCCCRSAVFAALARCCERWPCASLACVHSRCLLRSSTLPAPTPLYAPPPQALARHPAQPPPPQWPPAPTCPRWASSSSGLPACPTPTWASCRCSSSWSSLTCSAARQVSAQPWHACRMTAG
jgi:hypothetical protein